MTFGFRHFSWIISVSIMVAGMALSWHYIEKWRGGLNIPKEGTVTEVRASEEFFNLHVLFMLFGYLLPNVIAAGSFRFFTFLERDTAKMIHQVLNTLAMASACAGFGLVYQHQQAAYPDYPHFYSPHTWIGLATMIIFAINWIMGVLVYGLQLFPLSVKKFCMPIHKALGSISLFLVAMSCMFGFFSNYHYDFKYNETGSTPDRQAEKMDIINSSLTYLVIGTILVAFYIHHEGLKRPTPPVSQSEAPDLVTDSKEEAELENSIAL